jgi:hypothetical protein
MFNNLAIIDSNALLLHAQGAVRQMALAVAQNPQSMRYGEWRRSYRMQSAFAVSYESLKESWRRRVCAWLWVLMALCPMHAQLRRH